VCLLVIVAWLRHHIDAAQQEQQERAPTGEVSCGTWSTRLCRPHSLAVPQLTPTQRDLLRRCRCLRRFRLSPAASGSSLMSPQESASYRQTSQQRTLRQP
jgi:hypothetical protein